MATKRVTKDEIMVCAAAREIRDGDVVFIGQGYPLLAAVVAKKTHAPNSIFMTEGGLVDFDPYTMPTHVSQATCSRGASYYCDLIETFAIHLRSGSIDVGFLGAAQVDKYGNLNSSYVGDLDSDPARITGSGGAHEIGSYAGRTLVILRKGKFVEKLDYLTTPGYLEGCDSREALGIPGGPAAVITPKGVFRFDPTTKEMYLDSCHPGSTIEEIRAETPWDLKESSQVRRTSVPTDEEIAIMRETGPCIALGMGFTIQVTVENLMKFSRT
jgi:glutaconate CoA-transferase subunit B